MKAHLKKRVRGGFCKTFAIIFILITASFPRWVQDIPNKLYAATYSIVVIILFLETIKLYFRRFMFCVFITSVRDKK
jgi:hypothetical protein